MAIFSAPRPAGYRLDPTRNLYLDSRSPYLLQGTAPGTEGIQQAFPATAVDLITTLGATGVILPANVLAIYLADTASPLVDSLGLGPNLVAAGGSLTGRECVGPPGTSFTSKVGVETFNGASFASANAAFVNPNANVISFLLVARTLTSIGAHRQIISKMVGAGTGWALDYWSAFGGIMLLANAAGGFSLVPMVPDGAWHCFAGYVDDTAFNVRLFSDISDGAVSNYAATATNAGFLKLGGTWQADAEAQVAYLACFDVALTSAQRATFWRAFQAAGLGTDPTYTRANPLVTRITNVFGNVACYGANQPAIGYNANASAGDNPLKTGVVCEDGATFLGLGSDNMPAYVGTNATVTATDGPSGMRDACRVADTDGVNAGFATSGAAVLAGATNVPFIYSAYVKSGGVGTNAVYQSYYTGDAGGPETFTNWTIAGAVSAVWRPFIGLTHTPVGAAHTAVVTRLIPTDNVGASLGTVDFAEVWGRQNAIGDRMTWRRVAAGAAATTGTPSLAYDNTGNALYSPAQGRLDVRVSDFAKQAERVIANYATEAGPYNCCTDPTNVWVSNLTTGSLTKRRLSDGGLVGHYALGVTPGHICYDSVNNYIWVCDRNARTVLAVNAATGGVVATYNAGPGGSQSRGICWDGTYVWVSNFLANTISKVRCSDGTLIGSYATAVGPYFSCYANGSVWVSCYTANFIRKLTAATGAFVADYAINRPTQPAYDGTNIWIPSETGNNVRKLTEATGAFVADYATGTSPSGCVYDGTNVWVGNTADQTVVKLLAATGALVQRYAGFGANPFGMAWDGINLWVSIDGGNVLTRVGAPQVFLALGADGGQGALWLDYAGGKTYAPLQGTTPQLRLRLWDDVAVLVGTATCGAVTTAEHIYVVEWDAALGKASVMEGATVLGSFAVVWVPEPNAITPIYVGCDSAGANAARCHVTLLEGFDF